MKDWNWTIFLVILAVTLLGAFSNKELGFKQAITIGLISGSLLGLLMAYFTRKEK